MIEIKKGRYSCGVDNCGDGNCVHEWISFFCPCCDHQLVHVKSNGNVFCSNHEVICDYGSTLRKYTEFHTVSTVMERKKQSLLKQEKEIKKQLRSIRKQIKEFSQKPVLE
jgi:hypothetical protein